MSIVKIHKMCTWFAVFGSLLGSALFFFGQIDRQLYLNIVPAGAEDIVSLAAMLIGTLTVLSLVVSVVLSLYRIADRS